MSSAALALRQVRFTNKAFWRNPASAFFTFAFPLMFLVIFTALLGNGTSDFGRAPFVVHIKDATYYVVATFQSWTAQSSTGSATTLSRVCK